MFIDIETTSLEDAFINIAREEQALNKSVRNSIKLNKSGTEM